MQESKAPGRLLGEEMRNITFVVYSGGGARVLEELHKRGIESASLYHARGSAVGDPEDSHGLPTVFRKEVVTVIVPEARADEIFELVFEVAGVDRPYGGFVTMSKLEGATEYRLPDTSS